jgi:hypothetical protein
LGWIGFIKEYEGVIDAKTGSFTIKPPSHHVKDFAFLPEDILLDAYTETTTVIQLHETTASNIAYIERYEPLFQQSGITVMPGIYDSILCNDSKQFSIVLTNLTSKTVFLNKLTIVAIVESLDHLSTCNVICEINLDDNPKSDENKNNSDDNSFIDIMNTLDSKFPLINLNDDEIQQVKILIKKYAQLFITNKQRSTAMGVYHEIDTGTARPLHCAPNRVAFKEREYIQQQVQEMLKNKVIQPSKSPWASRIVLVKKKDGKLRFCVDYRTLNSITKKDVYPLPRIDDSLAMLKKGKFFTTLDLFAGYWQIPLASDSKEKTAFITDSGLFEFNVMPFGLCNAPATFQRFMDATLAGLKWKSLLVYMDDIIIFSTTFDEHVKDLDEVFTRLDNANITLNINKCEFFKEKIHYLGHVVSVEGIQPSQDKIKAILNKNSPRNIKELHNWLGICSYYRAFIPNFAKLCAPLYGLLRRDIGFLWTEKEENIITELKQYLSTQPILNHPNFDYPFILRTDACIEGLGATLSQLINSKENVIQYLSRSVQPSERNWPIQHLEALAIIWACESIRAYIIGSKVLIKTDHKSLEWLKESKIPRLIR